MAAFNIYLLVEGQVSPSGVVDGELRPIVPASYRAGLMEVVLAVEPKENSVSLKQSCDLGKTGSFKSYKYSVALTYKHPYISPFRVMNRKRRGKGGKFKLLTVGGNEAASL